MCICISSPIPIPAIKVPFDVIAMNILFGKWRLALVAGFLGLPCAQAFPPGPDALIYGMVKNQYGTPLMNTADKVVLQTPSGVLVTASIQPNLAVGVNYAMRVPMDSGILPAPFLTNTLTAGAQYKLYVVVGSVTNLPIEMAGAYALMGNPAQQIRQDLTIGTDANGDGLPDAWELLFLAEIGTNLSLSSINVNADYGHDGRTLMQEYLLGNYPLNPTGNFSVKMVSQRAGSVVLAFTTMTGRTYTVLGSSNLVNWIPLSFTNLTAGSDAMSSFYSPNIQSLQIQTVVPAQAPKLQFFRVELQ
jgi:hypothetical protein